MWLVVGGRLTNTLIDAVEEYQGEVIHGEEMIEDLYSNREKYPELKCISILDAGLSTLKDWSAVKNVTHFFKDVTVIIYTRHPEMTPSEESFGSNTTIITNKGYISVSGMAKRFGDYK